MIKKYELIKEGDTWQLYFQDNEFKDWHFIRTYKKETTFLVIYNDIKNTYKNTDNYKISLEFNVN